jgi:hypothetical protein
MSTSRMAKVEALAGALPIDEKLLLAARLLEQVRSARIPAGQRTWSSLRGAAPGPLVGEDAQAWVSRTRGESDHRGDVRDSAHGRS